jgi:thiol-disulfide isomerase/thioredoxin
MIKFKIIDMKDFQYFKLLCLLLIFSCANPDQEIDADTSISKFVANPIPVKEQPVTSLEIGAVAPDFKLPGTDGKFYSLSNFKDADALVIIFTCNHCPTAQAYEDRIINVVKDYKTKGVDFVAISPNSPLGLLYEELGYSDLNDDFEEMKIRVQNKKYNFPYLYDGDDQAISLKYGPVATPHIFVFDKNRKLAYRGRLDTIEKPGKGNAEDLRLALDELLKGEKISQPITKTFGCSTKWGWKLKMKEKANEQWKKEEVTISQIDSEGIQDLLKNEEGNKLRLINVWATWCGPCVIEYPEFIALQRMYGGRDFEFISISADSPEHQDKVLKFLKEKYSAVTNYLFSKDDKYQLIEAIDEDWNGALPYTILIEPNGNMVWKHQGEVDFYELKKVIVEHDMIGRYF